MADLSEIQSSLAVKIADGDEQNYLKIDPLGRANVKQYDHGIFVSTFLLNGSNSNNMNVNGSLANPQLFSFSPINGTPFFIERVTLYIEDNSDFTANSFGGINTLANGIQLQYRSNGTDYTLCTHTSNFGLFSSFEANSLFIENNTLLSNLGFYRGSMIFNLASIRLVNSSDYFRVAIRDNLTGLNRLSVQIFGRYDQ